MFETEADFRTFLIEKVTACGQFTDQEKTAIRQELGKPLSDDDMPDIESLVQVLMDAEMVEVFKTDDAAQIEAFNERQQAVLDFLDQFSAQV